MDINTTDVTYDKEQKIWSGPQAVSIYNTDSAVGKLIFTQMRNYPKNVCQINDIDGKVLTNREALTWAIRVAQHLKKLGFGPNDMIGIVARNTTYLLPVALACFFNCTPFHAINPQHDEKTISHMFGITKPRLIFCDAGEYEKIHAAVRDFQPLIYTVSDRVDGVTQVADLLEPTSTEWKYEPEQLTSGGDRTAVILCSSGTTGLPKAVCISNQKLFMEHSALTCEDVIFTASGLDWVSGLLYMIIGVLQSVPRVITNRPYSPELFVQLVRKYRITCTFVAPRHMAALLEYPLATRENLSSIRILGCGGGFISTTTLERFQRLLPEVIINFGYGLTEIGVVAWNHGIEHGTSVGKLWANLQVRIVDEEGHNLGPNKLGEIYVYSPQHWEGYYGNAEETRRMQDSAGWYHTGDLGYFDDQGYLYVVDRKKDILKYQGEHYWPTEIEQAVAELPEVVDVCVVGIYDKYNDDLAGGLVVKAKGSSLTEDHIIEHVKNRLVAPHKQLNAGVQFVDELPQNANGKTLKPQAKRLFMSKAGLSVDR